MKEKLLFKAYAGSKLYGTNSINSDIDIKGVFLPDINDLILGKAPKHYVLTTSDKKHNKDDVDETYYSLHYFLELVAKGDTNALDILFAYTNKDAVIYIDPIFQKILDNKDKLITKNVNAYLGYCKSQSIKYSFKGDKLSAYNKLKDFLQDLVDKNIKNEDGAWLDLGTALREYKEYKVGIYSDYEKKGKVIGKRAPIAESIFGNKLFGDHDYIVIMNNNEIYLMVSDILFNMSESIVSTLHKVNKVISSYGKRSENAALNNGVDYKAISHCIRVLFQVEELLIQGYFTFPLKEAEFVKSIKYNTTNMSYNDIIKFIEDKMNYIESQLLSKSNLREKADFQWIDNFILQQYKN